MLMTLLSMVGGGLFRLLPELIALFKGKQDADHEYRMTELQLKIDEARASQQIDLAHAQAEIAANAADMAGMVEALKAQGTATGITWVDALSATVRPVLTYWWCLVLYTASKTMTVIVAWQAHTSLADMAPIVVTQFDEAVIGSIFAFWFVDRALRKQNQPPKA